MIFRELKEAINAMTEVELLQLVMMHTADGEFEIDMAVKYNGRAILLINYADDEGETDDSTMDAS